MAPRALLLVEDDDKVRGLLAEYFRQNAHVEVATARDGAEALHEMSSHAYSVIVLDLMMPHMSGIDFLVSLSAMTSDPSLKSLDQQPAVIVVTSTPQDDLPNRDIEDRFPTLVRGVMRKPLDVPALAKRVEALL